MIIHNYYFMKKQCVWNHVKSISKIRLTESIWPYGQTKTVTKSRKVTKFVIADFDAEKNLIQISQSEKGAMR
jgi:hypothetical protein